MVCVFKVGGYANNKSVATQPFFPRNQTQNESLRKLRCILEHHEAMN